MKYIASVLLAGCVAARSPDIANRLWIAADPTENDCTQQEGATLGEHTCSSLWFFKCDEYSISPASTCNVMTYSNS